MRKFLNTIIALVIVALLAAGAAYWLASHHVVQGDDGVMVLDKRFLTFEDTRVDIRGWGIRDFDEHMHIRRALVAEGYGDLISELKQDELKGSVNDIIESTETKILRVKQTVDDWLISLTSKKGATDPPPPPMPNAQAEPDNAPAD
ncbi:MAG: hypothetical protein HQ559_15145 [Lentisphaerae bacterium]|nr:hypothetical protein [Lentisphaerota bacterium]